MKLPEEREIVDYAIYFKTSGEEGGGCYVKKLDGHSRNQLRKTKNNPFHK